MVIVVGYTHRAESQAAFRWAVEEARLRSARLHLVRTMGLSGTETPERARQRSEAAAEAQAEGDRVVAELAEKGVEATFEFKPADTSPGRSLVDTANREAADLIVIGMRRRSPVGKLVMGSVSQEVLLHADCPVVAIKDPDEA